MTQPHEARAAGAQPSAAGAKPPVAGAKPPAAGAKPPAVDGLLSRFDRVERAVHWINATLFVVLLVTGAILFIEPLSLAVGRRALVENVHLYCGLALPVPLALGVAGRWGRGLRADLSRLNRWTTSDRLWFRGALSAWEQRQRRWRAAVVGKFNAGQKLNAAYIAGVIVVMLGTGVIMRWYSPWPLSWRTGATFVHDWLALLTAIVILGHVGFAVRDPEALRSMVRGTISHRWASNHAPGWLDEMDELEELSASKR